MGLWVTSHISPHTTDLRYHTQMCGTKNGETNKKISCGEREQVLEVYESRLIFSLSFLPPPHISPRSDIVMERTVLIPTTCHVSIFSSHVFPPSHFATLRYSDGAQRLASTANRHVFDLAYYFFLCVYLGQFFSGAVTERERHTHTHTPRHSLSETRVWRGKKNTEKNLS